MMQAPNHKWRPTLALVTAALIAIVLSLPIAGLVLFGFDDGRIMRLVATEPARLALFAAFILIGAALAWYVMMRAVTRPVRALTARSARLERGDRTALEPLAANGTRETAELAEHMLAMARGITRRSDRVSAFANHVAHELRTPLAAIIGAAELLGDDDGTMPSDKRAHFAANIAADARRLDTLADRLRAQARADAAGPANATTSIDAAIAASDSAGLSVHLSGDPSLEVMMAQENLVVIIANLARNSASHGARSLDLSACKSGANIALTIGDDGSGVESGAAAQIFEPFFSTRKDSGGTGLGLFIVRTLVEAHGGTIALVPADRGAKFSINLPAALRPV
jgi:signal transduction histidine kinase